MTPKCLTPDIAETLNDWPVKPPRPTAKSPILQAAFQKAFRITPTSDQMRERYDWPEAFYPESNGPSTWDRPDLDYRRI